MDSPSFLTKCCALSVTIFVLASLIPLPVEAAKPPYTRLFYYRQGPLAEKSLYTYPSSIDIFAPQVYELLPDGTLSGGLKKEVFAFVKKKKMKVMPLITNGKFSESVYKSILSDPIKQETTARALILEAKDRGYIGWQVDFEQMTLDDRDLFSAFIKKLAERLHQNNLKISVAVIAQTSENPADYPNDLWQKIIGVYDYAALASSVDFVSVMSYDDPHSKGPVTGYEWLQKVLAYSLSKIPKEKLSLGIPLYYWQWNMATGKRIGIGGNEGLDNVFKKYNVRAGYDQKEKASFAAYAKGGVPYIIWYENAKSVREKIALVKKNNLLGMSFWALGLEVPSIFNVIQK